MTFKVYWIKRKSCFFQCPTTSYEYDEVENANILLRSETLNQIGNHPEGNIIITYPEALSEKVINKKSLASNTFLMSKGEKLDREFLEEFSA